VYGANAKLPFSVEDPVDQPVSLYAASKRANELMAHSYAHLYGLNHRPALLHGLRTLGPARHGAVQVHPAMLEGRPIEVYNHGRMARDFTYIDDIVESIARLRRNHPGRPRGNRPASCSTSAAASRWAAGVRRLPGSGLGIKAQRDYLPLQATCWRPGPMSAHWRAGSTSPQVPLGTASGLSLAGTGISTGLNHAITTRTQVASQNPFLTYRY
jgi:UDP-glucuronate 4-epimerase